MQANLQLAVALLLLLQGWWAANQSVETIPYSRFVDLVHQHKVKSVQAHDRDVTATLTEAPKGARPSSRPRSCPRIS